MKLSLPRMMLKALWKPLTPLLAFAMIGIGCARITPARMVPNLQPCQGARIGNGVKILEVTEGTEGVLGGPVSVTKEQFSKALILAIEKSGLFGSVSTQSGDLRLHTKIRWQSQRGLWPSIAAMLVQYQLIDQSGKILWAESYYSESSSRAFSGGTRCVLAREGAVRENLVALVKGLREWWSKQ
jgi:hypothetical protein